MTLSSQAMWKAVVARDRRRDGAFVYAVRTTGVFCRPSCASRRPNRPNVEFYPLAGIAIGAGFRPCRRCRPQGAPLPDTKLVMTRAVLEAIVASPDATPSLAVLAKKSGWSASHLQRTFARVVGISPRDYARALREQRVKTALKSGEPVAQAAFGAGYGSLTRLYEGSVGLGVPPAAFAKGAEGAVIAYATAASPLGRVLVAATERGVCGVHLGADDAALLRELRADYPKAALHRDPTGLRAFLANVLDRIKGKTPAAELPLAVRATAFQWRVWKELRAIRRGETRTYSDIAAAIGKPTAHRAVARACASNRLALVVPCHRVVGRDGQLTGYRWGVARKRDLLARESGR